MMNATFVHRSMLHSGLSWSVCVTAMILLTCSVESVVCTATPPLALAGRRMYSLSVEVVQSRLGLRSEELLLVISNQPVSNQPVKKNLSHTATNPDVPHEIDNTDKWFNIFRHTVTGLQDCGSQEDWYEMPWYAMFP